MMTLPVVYILVSREEDCFYEMFLLSLYSLRIHNPDCKVFLVMDPETYARVASKDEPLLKTVALLEVAIPDGFAPLLRSRYLKTRLRSIVEGDFLYLDTDTLVCSPLDEIDLVDCDIAAVANENGPTQIKSDLAASHCRKAGFGEMKKIPYFNGGVFLVRDSDKTRLFFDVWHERWQESVRNGVPLDQPAMSRANQETGFPVQTLPGEWNCQICSAGGVHYLKTAKVLHYFASYGPFVDAVIRPHVKMPDRVDEYAAGIAENPREQGRDLFHLGFNGRFRRYYSELLFRLIRLPSIYKLVRRGAGKISEVLSR